MYRMVHGDPADTHNLVRPIENGYRVRLEGGLPQEGGRIRSWHSTFVVKHI